MKTQTSFFVNTLDLFGQQINMQIFGKDKKKTLFGAFIGLISLCLISAVSMYFIVGFLNKGTLTVIQSQDTSTYPYNNLTEFPILLGLRTPLGVNIPTDGSIFNVHVYQRFDNYTNGTYYGATYTPLPVSMCTQDIFGKFDIEKIPEAKSDLCVKPSDHNSLKSYFVDAINGYTGIYFFISRCNPLTNSNCKNKTIIDTSLENAVFGVTLYNSNIDNNNITCPNQYVTSTSTIAISNSLYKKKIIYLTQNLYQDDTGFLFESFTTYNFYSIGDTTTDYSLNYPPSYLTLTGGETPVAHVAIFNTPYIQRTYRSYMKAQTVLAQIGGIIKFITTFAALITNFVTRKIAFAEIGDYVFDYNKTKTNNVKVNIAVEKEEINAQEIRAPDVKLHPITEPVSDNFKQSEVAKGKLPPVRKVKINKPVGKLSLWDQICVTRCAKNKRVMKIYDLTEASIYKKASIESIVADSYRLEELSRITLNDDLYKSLYESKLKFRKVEKQD